MFKNTFSTVKPWCCLRPGQLCKISRHRLPFQFVLRRIKKLFAIFSLSLLFVIPSLASTVAKVEFDELAQNAELVFEGKAVSSQVRPAADGSPCTYFMFNVVEIIKGTFDQATIELCFAGGTLNGLTMQVSDMNMPTVGEAGIYFVDALGKEPVHPLLGWSQGHYLIKKDQTQVDRVVPAFPQANSADAEGKQVQSLQISPDLETFKQMIREQQ